MSPLQTRQVGNDLRKSEFLFVCEANSVIVLDDDWGKLSAASAVNDVSRRISRSSIKRLDLLISDVLHQIDSQRQILTFQKLAVVVSVRVELDAGAIGIFVAQNAAFIDA